MEVDAEVDVEPEVDADELFGLAIVLDKAWKHKSGAGKMRWSGVEWSGAGKRP